MDLTVRNLTKTYNGRPVLDGFSHVFPEGRVTCILGRSGQGKTTLLRLIAGLEAPDAGEIVGVPEGGLSMVFQEDRLPEQLTAAGCLRCVLARSPDREARIQDALRRLALAEAPDKPVRAFSGGMRRRVALARALLYPARLLLLDEPFKGLDDATRTLAVDYARERLQGRTALLVTHDEADAAAFDAEVVRL